MMEILSDEEDREIREKVRKEYGLIDDPEETWEPVNIDGAFSVSYHDRPDGDKEQIFDIAAKNSERVLILAYEKGQYVPEAEEKFKEKYGGNVFEVEREGFFEAYRDLIVQYIVPENLSWIILIDHDGNLYFSGDIKEDAKRSYGEID